MPTPRRPSFPTPWGGEGPHTEGAGVSQPWLPSRHRHPRRPFPGTVRVPESHRGSVTVASMSRKGLKELGGKATGPGDSPANPWSRTHRGRFTQRGLQKEEAIHLSCSEAGGGLRAPRPPGCPTPSCLPPSRRGKEQPGLRDGPAVWSAVAGDAERSPRARPHSAPFPRPSAAPAPESSGCPPPPHPEIQSTSLFLQMTSYLPVVLKLSRNIVLLSRYSVLNHRNLLLAP